MFPQKSAIFFFQKIVWGYLALLREELSVVLESGSEDVSEISKREIFIPTSSEQLFHSAHKNISSGKMWEYIHAQGKTVKFLFSDSC